MNLTTAENASIAQIDDRIAFYVPSKFGADQVTSFSKQEHYVELLSAALSIDNKGATVVDNLLGVFKSKRGDLVYEKVKMVYSYSWNGLGGDKVARYIGLAVQMGIETQQDAVLVEIGNQVFLVESDQFLLWD